MWYYWFENAHKLNGVCTAFVAQSMHIFFPFSFYFQHGIFDCAPKTRNRKEKLDLSMYHANKNNTCSNCWAIPIHRRSLEKNLPLGQKRFFVDPGVQIAIFALLWFPNWFYLTSFFYSRAYIIRLISTTDHLPHATDICVVVAMRYVGSDGCWEMEILKSWVSVEQRSCLQKAYYCYSNHVDLHHCIFKAELLLSW